MPANRSRTAGWRRCLQQVLDRGGSLEVAVARSDHGAAARGRDLVWRVRLLAVTDREILVEQPSTLGQPIELDAGIDLVAILAVGQNRWVFGTANLGVIRYPLNGQKPVSALRLLMPENVERCQRRNHERMQIGDLNLPEVEMWPLLDPKSVILAERANELRLDEEAGSPHAGRTRPNDEDTMPEVGPKFTATLVNIGGGGVGLRVRPEDAHVLTRHKVFWLRFSLPPELTAPVCATGKLAHTSVDSTQHTYAGMAFDFSFNPAHQRVVAEQIRRYIGRQQQAQRRTA